MIYVMTSNVNMFDNLRTPACPVDHNVKYLCFTNLPIEVLPKVFPWQYVPISMEGAACRIARAPKILAHEWLPKDAEYSIYHDANFQLRVDPNQVMHQLLSREIQWAAHKHPCRNCIYKEADVLIKEKIGTTALVQAEIARYRERGHPANDGLWANGMIVRRHTPETQELNELWWKLYSEGAERDQLSFPVARRELNVPIRTIESDVWSSPYILFRWHAAWTNKDDNPDYLQQRSEIRRRLETMGVQGFPAY